MAKRSRGAVRPGQRRPTQRVPTRPTAPAGVPRPSGSLTEAEEARAAELEAEVVAQEQAAEEARRSRSARQAARADVPRSRESSLFSAKAAEEYAYVARDVRRIVTVGGSLLGVLAILFVLIEVLHVIRI